MGRNPNVTRVVGVILLIAGAVLLVIGVVYFTVPADKLPSFLGRLPHVTAHRRERAQAGMIGGGILLIASYFTLRRSRAAAG